jgi:hypothetical protein
MTKKEVSNAHERYVARLYRGIQSPSSGASSVDKGDVRIASSRTIFECKATGSPGGDSKYTTLIRQFEKVADEAWIEGKSPAVALRYFCPDSPLAGPDGWLDFTVRLTKDDAEREAWLSSSSQVHS